MNVLKWSIPSHNISITNMNGEDSSDVSRNNFVSTVSNYDDESCITNASLTFPMTTDLDESVVVCMNAVDMSSNCILFIKRKYQLYFEILFVIKKPQT